MIAEEVLDIFEERLAFPSCDFGDETDIAKRGELESLLGKETDHLDISVRVSSEADRLQLVCDVNRLIVEKLPLMLPLVPLVKVNELT